MNKNEIKNKIENYGCLTHAGIFHADDVFSTALLRIIFRDLRPTPVRVFKVPNDYKGLVYDIGFGEFDHHQSEVPTYEDGTKKASLGLLWDILGKETYSEEVYTDIRDNLIKFLDENDNTGKVVSMGGIKHPLADVIGCFNVNWDDEFNDSDSKFLKAVSVARRILLEKIVSSISYYAGKSVIEEAPMEDNIKILSKYAPWKEFVPEECIGVVHPSLRGGYALQSIDSNIYPLPKEWLEGKPEGCTFVHASLFIASFDTKENAIKASKEFSLLSKGNENSIKGKGESK